MPEPAIETDDDTDNVTRKPWYSWFVRHKRLTIAAAACVAIALAAAAVAPRLVSESESLVTDYLSALQDGDAAQALTIAGGGDKTGSFSSPRSGHFTNRPKPTKSFLSSDAINTGWSTVAVREIEVETSPSPSTDRVIKLTRVLATIAHGDRISRGEFYVVDDSIADGPRLEKPFVYIDASPFHDSHITIDEASKKMDPDHAPETIAIFPGTHELFGNSELVEPTDASATLLAMPSKPERILVPELSLTKQGKKKAVTSAEDRLDACAQSTKTHPQACPFGADEFSYDSEQTDHIWSESGALTDITDLKWEITTYPTFEFSIDGLSVHGAVVHPGWATVTGKSEGKKFSLECEIGSLYGSWTADDQFSFDAPENDPGSNCTET